MKGVCNQAWVTSVWEDAQVPGSLVLCHSLRKVLTTKQIVVLASPKLSPKSRELLHHNFDHLYYLEEHQNERIHLKMEDFAKLSVLSLKSFEKVVYSSVNLLVLRNCDEIFQENGEGNLLCLENVDLSIFLAKPCLKFHQDFLEDLGKTKVNGRGFEHYLQKWMAEQSQSEENCFSFLPEKYCRIVSSKGGITLKNEEEIAMVKFLEQPETIWMEKNRRLGLIEKMAAKYWMDIFNNEVKPILDRGNLRMDLGIPIAAVDMKKEPIAIVGMSCRFPGANNLEEFWNLLSEGNIGTVPPPPFRWLREQSLLSRPEFRKTNAGFLKVPVDEFDSKFFGMSPKEVISMDPQFRLLLEIIWEGLEDAGLDPQSLRGANGGVFMGSWTNDYRNILERSGSIEFYRGYMGNSIGAGAARISHVLGLIGPSIATESGCSSAMVATHLGIQSLRRGETELALACGVNLLLHPFDKDAMPMVMSPVGRCKTFDADADGFARAEGCAVLVMKRLSSALKDGDNIWGILRGSGVSQEGVSKSMGTPTVHCEAFAMTQALADAEVEDPSQVSYVETHGTGTIVGDPLEVAAIAKAYNSKKRDENKPLWIGSVKTNIGHTESCSGIAGIMKVILAMKAESIPPHLNFQKLNSSIDLEAVPAKIPLESVEWPRITGSPRIAGVSSFGITGTDAHVIVQEPPQVDNDATSISPLDFGFERPLHLLKISGKTEEALEILLEKYKEHFENNTSDSFENLAYSANTGRSDFPYRAVVIAPSNEEAAKIITNGKYSKAHLNSENAPGKICFLFTGQGSQYPGIAKGLYETSPVFRLHFDYVDKLLSTLYKVEIKPVLWGERESKEIIRTIYSQTSIFCVEYALLKLWESWGIKPDYVLGHSLGEFAAAVSAGILSVEDALKLVAERSLLVDKLQEGKMLVIKADKQKVESLMKTWGRELDYAAVNSDEQTVVAGNSQDVLDFCEFLKDKHGVKCLVLEATHAFHSKHMDPILEQYEKVTKTVKNPEKSATFPGFISGVKGSLIEDMDEVDSKYWVEHTRAPVEFLKASKLAAGAELGCKIFIEIGPQPVLSALTLINNSGISGATCFPSLRKNEDEWKTLLNSLGNLYLKGLDLNWKGLDQFCSRRKVKLPHYPFLGKQFWPDLMGSIGTPIHPLLGSLLPNASSSRLFTSSMNLRLLEYIKDHAIGNHVIFPGAGFLEMCLASGLATVESTIHTLPDPTRPMKIENLMILAPMQLEESKTCHVQTVVEHNNTTGANGVVDWNSLTIRIFHRLETPSSGETIKWVAHAQAVFTPFVGEDETQFLEGVFDLERFKEVLKAPGEDGLITEVYEKLGSIGLKFGPTFKSVERVWKDEETKTMVAKIKVPGVGIEPETKPESEGETLESSSSAFSDQYILHPAVIDAMLQSIMLMKNVEKVKKSKKLYVPICIGKFIWIGKLDEVASKEGIYVHVFDEEENKTNNMNRSSSGILVSGSGRILASVSGVEFIDTTAKTIESVLENQKSPMPDLWEEVWKGKMGPLQFRAPLENYPVEKVVADMEKRGKEIKEKALDPRNEEIHDLMDELSYYGILRGLYDCGWKPEVGTVFEEKELMESLGVLNEFRKVFGYYMETLGEAGVMERENGKESGWKIVSLPPSPSEVETHVNSVKFTRDLYSRIKSATLITKMGEQLANILKGKQSAIGILFPAETSKRDHPTMGEFYEEYGRVFDVNTATEKYITMRVSEIERKAGENEREHVLRFLEVGAGTGNYTAYVLKVLDDLGVPYEYTFTDISAAFFPSAEKKFEKYLKHLKFKKLNIEEDPLAQGFTPEYFDYVVACEVIHATRDIRESLGNVRMVLKPYAQCDLIETTEVSRQFTFIVGVLDGYWRFQDFELRPKHCTMSIDKWKGVAPQCGFKYLGTLPMYKERHSALAMQWKPLSENVPKETSKLWIIFATKNSKIPGYLKEKLEAVNRRVVEVFRGEAYKEEGDFEKYELRQDSEEDFKNLLEKVGNEEKVTLEGVIYCWALEKERVSQEEILQPYFYAAKHILTLKQKVAPRLIAITEGAASLEENDLGHFHASTLWGFTKAFRNEQGDINGRCLEVEPDSLLDESRLQEIFFEIWSSDHETQIAYRNGQRHAPRFQPYKPIASGLTVPPGLERFQLVLPETRQIADLQFGPLPTEQLKEDEVEVQVKTVALNFRDIFSVIKPIEEFNDVNGIGLDFAGIVKRIGTEVTKWKVGDLVFGINSKDTPFPNHVVTKQDRVSIVPDYMTMCEAATLPVAFATAYYFLVMHGKIQKGETVLIHTGSGGVGLSAVQVCQHYGCEIIATAGSTRKRNYLRSLGITHIFNSRNTQFSDQILEVTKGRGVDVALNSLTSDGFKEATLKACAQGARFLEMSKLQVWKKEDVEKLRPDVTYFISNTANLPEKDFDEVKKNFEEMMEKNVVTPLPYSRFDGVHIREALMFMQKTKHIGKIVCVMPELRRDEQSGSMETFSPLFSERSTYLITGGLGGIGFTVCKWMVEQGARNIILAGRRPPTPSVQQAINELNKDGPNILVPVELDVADYGKCRELIEVFIPSRGLPGLRGVMHAAGLLCDGLVINQEWDKLKIPLEAKVKGAWNLHELTKTLNLEHFVMFSSLACLFGSPGQSNHSAGNKFEDTLVHYRHSMGLPATTIDWGNWGEVGVATEIDFPGIKPITNLQGLSTLEHVLKTQKLHTAACNVDSFTMASKPFPTLATYIDEAVWKLNRSSSSFNSLSLNSEEFWQKYDAQEEAEGKIQVLKDEMSRILRHILKLDETDVINENAELQDLGVDSLMFVEIKNGLQTLFGDRVTINASELRDCTTLKTVCEKLHQMIEGINDNDVIPTKEQVIELLKEDAKLPEEIGAKEGQQIKNTVEIQRVFLTGATGTLGPYILKKLTQMSQISQVVCLVRNGKLDAGEERLKRILEEKQLLEEVNMSKVSCVTGCVTKPHFGLEQEEWEKLSGEIDGVIHCAAIANHLEQYIKRDGGKIDSRAVNIRGTKNVLEFCCNGNLKHLYHAASLFCTDTADEQGRIQEDWPVKVDDFEYVVTHAYAITKYVGDLLMRQAVERGIPCKVFRFPFICGDSKTGRFPSIEKNHLLMRYLFCMKNGAMPLEPTPMPILPVDICAEVSLKLFFEQNAPFEIFNIAHHNPDLEQEFPKVAEKFGYKVEFVEWADFVKKVKQDSSMYAIFKEAYRDEVDGQNVAMRVGSVEICRNWINGQVEDFWVSQKVKAFAPEFYEGLERSVEYLERDLRFAKEQGWFKKLGL